ncbi:hypothetical protein OAE87_00035 [bacterium]|nr:hypothetical protein [bacterium]
MPTTSKLTFAMNAVIDELEVHCNCLGMSHLEKGEYLSIRQNLADGVVRGLIVISIHQKLLELQLDDIEAAQAVALVEAE